jgi:nitrogen regulatory protein PII 1
MNDPANRMLVGWRLTMKLIRAIIRPECEETIVEELDRVNLGAMTKIDVFGQGKQKSQAEVPTEWEESLTRHEKIPKILLMIAVEDTEARKVIDIIMDKARTGKVGDGKIFITSIDQAYSVGTKTSGL